jgi:Protein of unknown function (DUF4239)
MFTGIGLMAFCCTFGAALVGLLLSGVLPDSNRTKATKKAVQNTMSVLGILSALVLGLLVADTKASFDTSSKEVEQFAANLTLLDRELMHFEQETKDARDELRAFTTRKIALTWPADRRLEPVMHDAQTVQMLDDIQKQLRAWTSQTEIQREGRKNALQLIDELKRTSHLLAVQQNNQTPPAFLIVVIFWLSMLFLSYAIFAPLNTAAVVAMLVCSLSVSIAVNLIFDMDRPFAGFIRVSATPMLQALDQMKP